MSKLGTATEGANYLRMSTKTFYKLLGEGKIPGAQRVGGNWRINMKVLKASMADDDASLTSNEGARSHADE